MFTMTPTAAMQVRIAASHSDATELALRVAARLERDGTVSYGMGFDDPQEGETPALQMDGVTVLIAPPSRPLLAGTVLDFVEMAPGEFNFIFIPPASAGSAGSGGCASQAASSGGGCGSGGCHSGGCGSSRGAGQAS